MESLQDVRAIGIFLVAYLLLSFSLTFLVRRYKLVERLRATAPTRFLVRILLRAQLIFAVLLAVADPIPGLMIVFAALVSYLYYRLGTDYSYLASTIQQAYFFAAIYFMLVYIVQTRDAMKPWWQRIFESPLIS